MADPKPRFVASAATVVRTPLLPFQVFLDLGVDLESAGASEATRGATLDRDAERVRDRISRQIQRPDVAAALTVASPGLVHEVPGWLGDAANPRWAGVERALVRYVSRMATRPTPFGLCAGITTIARGDATRVELAPVERYRRRTQLHGNAARRLFATSLVDPTLRRRIRYRSNTSLYRSAGRLRYAYAATDTAFGYQLAEAVPDAVLVRVLERARSFVPAPTILELIVEGAGIELAEAEDVLDQLIVSQLLEPEVAPLTTGEDTLAPLRVALAESMPALAATVENALGELAELDRRPDSTPATYEAALDPLVAALELESRESLLQVDLYKPAVVATRGPRLDAAVLDAVETLRRISPHEPAVALSEFARRFSQRYERRHVPLLEALDEDIGIGFDVRSEPSGTPVLADLPFPGEPARRDTTRRLLHRALAARTREWVLDDADLEALAPAEPARLPDAFTAFFSVAARSSEAIDAGDFQLRLETVAGPSGAGPLGRFCLVDETLRDQVRAHLRAEEALRPGVVFAEIVHDPANVAANVVRRPCLRRYEIPLLGGSAAADVDQIPVQDLSVSVRDGRVALYSQRLGVEVVPRLSNAFRHRLGFLPYRFLSALVYQGTDTLAWSWGPIATHPHLPRVRRGRVVFALEQWNLDRADVQPLGHATRVGVFRAAQDLRARLALPRFIQLIDGDNRLTVDFDNVLSVESFAHLVRARDTVRLEELWPAPDELVVTGPEGRFRAEWVATYVRAQPAAPEPAAPACVPPTLTRSFLPGSEWLYVKLYAGQTLLDAVLLALAPAIRRFLTEGRVRRWHFVRYADPDHHLRLRFQADPGAIPALLAELHHELAPLHRNGLFHRLQLDTYERELERYGGDAGMEPSETIFHHDSTAVLAILEALHAEDLDEERWKLGPAGILSMHRAVGLDDEALYAEISRSRDVFAAEFRADTELLRELGKRYREHQEALRAVLGGTEPALAAALAALAERDRAIRELAAGEQRASIATRVGSYAHMFANRLFSSSSRKNELVAYDLVRRYLAAQRARG